MLVENLKNDRPGTARSKEKKRKKERNGKRAECSVLTSAQPFYGFQDPHFFNASRKSPL
jgi:hypothetical protein